MKRLEVNCLVFCNPGRQDGKLAGKFLLCSLFQMIAVDFGVLWAEEGDFQLHYTSAREEGTS